MAKIVLKFMDDKLEEFRLVRKGVTIGRNKDCGIPIDNQAVSSYHAKIYREGNKFIIEDADSSNGTFVNGKRIFKKALVDGDIIVIGKHSLHFETEGTEGLGFDSEFGEGSAEKTVVLDRKVQEKIVAKASGREDDSEECRMLGGIKVIEGKSENQYYLMKSRIATIGKSKNADIRLRGFFAPKVAAHIYRRRDGYHLVPPGNGEAPKVNGVSVNKEQPLNDGDIIEAGGLKMLFYQKQLH